MFVITGALWRPRLVPFRNQRRVVGEVPPACGVACRRLRGKFNVKAAARFNPWTLSRSGLRCSLRSFGTLLLTPIGSWAGCAPVIRVIACAD